MQHESAYPPPSGHKEIPRPNQYYIVTEQWDIKNPDCPMDSIFGGEKIFETQNHAEYYYAQRQKTIAMRKLLFF